MKKKLLVLIWFQIIYLTGYSQYTTLNAHSHNDYRNSNPFWSAYNAGFGSIEADIWEVNGKLLVAHAEDEISPEKTLDLLYIQPIVKLFEANGGKAWAKSNNQLQLMIEPKSSAEPTLTLLIQILAQYPEVFDQKVNKNAVRIIITGKQPAASAFTKYPGYIYFDGNLIKPYTSAQLKRVPLFSFNLQQFTKWNGKDGIPVNEAARLSQVIDSVHHLGSKIRFWNAPDNMNAWKVLMGLKVDYLNTDKIDELSAFLKN